MGSKRIPFSIAWHQVPDVPESKYYRDLLRWCVVVMDDDDPDLHFTSSLLTHALKDGLSTKQEPYALKIIDRVLTRYDERKLDCQRTPEGISPAGLRVITEGRE